MLSKCFNHGIGLSGRFVNVFDKAKQNGKISLDLSELDGWLVHVYARDRSISMVDAQGYVKVAQVS